MTILVPNTGEVIALKYLTGYTASTENLVYKIYTNNITPAETDTAGTYVEASGGGYTSKTLTGASWTITEGAPSSATYAAQTWTFTGPLTTNLTCYGYYVIRASSLDLVFSESQAAFVPTNNGDTITLTPALTAD